MSTNRSINNYIIEQDLEEGFIRGLAGDVKDTVTFLGLIDSLEALFGDADKCFKIIKERAKQINYFINKYEFKGTKSNSSYIKNITNKIYHWRFYFLLHDKTFKELISKINKNKIERMFVDTSFSKRVIKDIYSARSNKDLINVVNLYVLRSATIIKLCRQKKIPEKIIANIANIFAQGVIDLEYIIKKIIRYNN
jgi:hypothetical protein